MSCTCKTGCTLFSAIASIIVGIIAALLTITGVIAITPAFSWVALGVSVAYLAIVFVAYRLRRTEANSCCGALNALLTGILGSALTSVILLGITFAATSIIGAVIAGALLGFLTLTLTGTACLIKCTSGCTAE